MLQSCFQSSVGEIPFSSFRGKMEMSQPIRGYSSHLIFPISQKNTNVEEDIDILNPVKCHRIAFSGIREVENVPANQRPRQPPCFSNRPEYKLGKEH